MLALGALVALSSTVVPVAAARPATGQATSPAVDAPAVVPSLPCTSPGLVGVSGPRVVAWSLDGDRTVLASVKDDGAMWGAHVAPTGDRVVWRESSYQGAEGRAGIVRTDGAGAVDLTDATAPVVGAVWSPDGSRIALSRHLGGGTLRLEVVDVTGSVELTVPSVVSRDWAAVPAAFWSPDGTRIAFVPGAPALSIGVAEVATGSVRTVTHPGPLPSGATLRLSGFSADGSTLAGDVVGNPASGSPAIGVWWAPAEATELASVDGVVGHSAWSPVDGRLAALAADGNVMAGVPGSTETWTPVRPAAQPYGVASLLWRPDGGDVEALPVPFEDGSGMMASFTSWSYGWSADSSTRFRATSSSSQSPTDMEARTALEVRAGAVTTPLDDSEAHEDPAGTWAWWLGNSVPDLVGQVTVGPQQARWAPHGAELAWARAPLAPRWPPEAGAAPVGTDPFGVHVWDPVGGVRGPVLPGHLPSWSPDGTQLASALPWGGIAVGPVDGSAAPRLIGWDRLDVAPTWTTCAPGDPLDPVPSPAGRVRSGLDGLAQPAGGVDAAVTSTDGDVTLFSTTDSLVPEDVDAELDAYLWRGAGSAPTLVRPTGVAGLAEGSRLAVSDSGAVVVGEWRRPDGTVEVWLVSPTLDLEVLMPVPVGAWVHAPRVDQLAVVSSSALVAGDDDGTTDLYVIGISGEGYRLVEPTLDGVALTDLGPELAVSTDGSAVAVHAMPADDPGGVRRPFLVDTVTGAATPLGGTGVVRAVGPGGRVALVDGPWRVVTAATGAAVPVPVPYGADAVIAACPACVSSDGRHAIVAVASGGQPSGVALADLEAGVATEVSVRRDGLPAVVGATPVGFTESDGRVRFLSDQDGLFPGDTTAAPALDLAVWDPAAAADILEPPPASGPPACPPDTGPFAPGAPVDPLGILDPLDAQEVADLALFGLEGEPSSWIPSPDGGLRVGWATRPASADGSFHLAVIVESVSDGTRWLAGSYPYSDEWSVEPSLGLLAVDELTWCGDGWLTWLVVDRYNAPNTNVRRDQRWVARPDGSVSRGLGGELATWSPAGDHVAVIDKGMSLIDTNRLDVRSWSPADGAGPPLQLDEWTVSSTAKVVWSPGGGALAHQHRDLASCGGVPCWHDEIGMWSVGDDAMVHRTGTVGEWVQEGALHVTIECGDAVIAPDLTVVTEIDGVDLTSWFDPACIPPPPPPPPLLPPDCPPDGTRPTMGAPTAVALTLDATTLRGTSADGQLELHLVNDEATSQLAVRDVGTDDRWIVATTTSEPDALLTRAFTEARFCGDGWVSYVHVEEQLSPWSKPRSAVQRLVRPDGSGTVDLGGVQALWSPTGDQVVTITGNSNGEWVVLDTMVVKPWHGSSVGASLHSVGNLPRLVAAWSPGGEWLAYGTFAADPRPAECELGWGPECEDPSVWLWPTSGGAAFERPDTELVGWVADGALQVEGACGTYVVDTTLQPAAVIDGQPMAAWIDAGCAGLYGSPPPDRVQCPASVPLGGWVGVLPDGSPLPEGAPMPTGAQGATTFVATELALDLRQAAWRYEVAEVDGSPVTVMTVEADDGDGVRRPLWRQVVDPALVDTWGPGSLEEVRALAWCPGGSWLVWRAHRVVDGFDTWHWVVAAADGSVVHELDQAITFEPTKTWMHEIEVPHPEDPAEQWVLRTHRWEGHGPVETVELGALVHGTGPVRGPTVGSLGWAVPNPDAHGLPCVEQPELAADPASPCSRLSTVATFVPGVGVRATLGRSVVRWFDADHLVVELACGRGVVDLDGDAVLPGGTLDGVGPMWSPTCTGAVAIDGPDEPVPLAATTAIGVQVVVGGAPLPGGELALLDGSDELDRAMVGTDGTATFVVDPGLPAGRYDLTVRYLPEHRAASDHPIEVIVDDGALHVALDGVPTSALVGSSTALTGVVTRAWGDGTVPGDLTAAVLDDGEVVGQALVTDGILDVPVAPTRAGVRSWTVRISDEHGERAQVEQVVVVTHGSWSGCTDVEPLPATDAELWTCVAASYADIDDGHPFGEAIGALTDAGVVGGYPDGGFHPGAVVTRQAAAAWLYRLAGSPDGEDPSCDAAAFPDVSADHRFCGEIAWMAAEGLTSPYPDGGFHPGAPASRQALVAWLWRRAGEPTADPAAPTFTDVPSGHPFHDAIAWAAGEAIATGYDDGTFRPASPVTRQAAAAVLWRAL